MIYYFWRKKNNRKTTKTNPQIEIWKKDSLDMSNNDRLLIKNKINDIDESKIIITHWTDTLIDTWKYLKDISNKLIVLVWASRPWSMNNSDAEFNIWYALGALNILWKNNSKWVYIAMNWEFFDVKNVTKWEDWVFRKIK